MSKKILLACSPKSGSTYLSQFLSHYFSVPLVNLVPAHGFRNQEIDEGLIPVSGGFVAQNHIMYSEFTDCIITRHEIKTIVLTRNIFDSIFSLREHLATESHIGPLVHLSPSFHSLSVDEQFEILMFFAAPWYLNFIASWSNKNYQIYLYENIFSLDVGGAAEYLKKLLEEIDPETEHSDYMIQMALHKVGLIFNRLNVGRVGRGLSLIKSYKNQLERAALLLAPTVNFNDIGLFVDVASEGKLLDYELKFLRSRQEKLFSEISAMSEIIILKQQFIDTQRSYIDAILNLKSENK